MYYAVLKLKTGFVQIECDQVNGYIATVMQQEITNADLDCLETGTVLGWDCATSVDIHIHVNVTSDYTVIGDILSTEEVMLGLNKIQYNPTPIRPVWLSTVN